MNAYWFEDLHTLHRPAIEDGQRKIYITTFVIVHPLELSPGDSIGAGDGWLCISNHGNRLPSKMESGDYLYELRIGNMSKEEMEKKSQKTERRYDENYFRHDPTQPKAKNKCEVIYRTQYIDERQGDRLRSISRDINSLPGFMYIIEKASNKFRNEAVTPSLLASIESYIKEECSFTLRRPVKGEVKAIADHGNIKIRMDDEFFLSLETIV